MTIRCFIYFVSVASAGAAVAVGPFQYRELHRLAGRMDQRAREMSSELGPMLSVSAKYLGDLHDDYFRDHGELNFRLLAIQGLGYEGYFQRAEALYLATIERMRVVQGGDTSDVAFVLDHLAEFYLRNRQFDKAYQTLLDAIRIRRTTSVAMDRAANGLGIALPQIVRETESAIGASTLLGKLFGEWENARTQFATVKETMLVARTICRLHLADLLTRTAELDIARNDLTSATPKLTEAIEINREYLGSLVSGKVLCPI